MEQKVNLRVLPPVGSFASFEEKLTLKLATAIHESESSNVAVSWEAQERAMVFVNNHGLSDILSEIFRLEEIKYVD